MAAALKNDDEIPVKSPADDDEDTIPF